MNLPTSAAVKYVFHFRAAIFHAILFWIYANEILKFKECI